MKQRWDNYSLLAQPVALPCFVDDVQRADVWADGYATLGQHYDGLRNKVEILPLMRNPVGFGGMIEIGQSYTMGVAALSRRIGGAR